MKVPCEIKVKSSRGLTVPDFLKKEDPSVEEEWEEMLWEEGFSPEDTAPSDRWENPGEEVGSATTFTAQGIFSREEDGSFRITYEDSEITGMEGCLTTFCLSGTGMFILLRQGTMKTCMVFEEKHRHLCDYGAAGGISSVFLQTHALKTDLKEEGGSVFVSYTVEMGGTRTERNELSVTVTPKFPLV